MLQLLVTRSGTGLSSSPLAGLPSFSAFDSTSEIWDDYYERFKTFVEANSIPDAKKAKIFLTIQSAATYKLLSTLVSQQEDAKDVNGLTMDDIEAFMKEHFDPTRFVVRERFKFWSDMKRKPGETILQLCGNQEAPGRGTSDKVHVLSEQRSRREGFIQSQGYRS